MKKQSEFLQYIKDAKKMTAHWPEWKKDALKRDQEQRQRSHIGQQVRSS